MQSRNRISFDRRPSAQLLFLLWRNMIKYRQGVSKQVFSEGNLRASCRYRYNQRMFIDSLGLEAFREDGFLGFGSNCAAASGRRDNVSGLFS